MTTRAEDDIEDTLAPELDEALLALDELASEDPEQALTMFDSLPEPVQALPNFQLVLGRAHQALGQLEAARDLIAKIIEVDGENADAHHLAGDVLEDLGLLDEANQHFLRTLALDQKAYAELEARQLTQDTTRALIEQTLASLPEGEGLRVIVKELPTGAEVSGGLDPRALFRQNGRDFIAYLASLEAELSDLEPEILKEFLGDAIARELGVTDD